MQNFDWNHAKAFLVTAEEGSLSAAARVLKLTQPTLGRQVAALEEELDVVLFERIGRRLELTPTGHELVAHLRRMAEAAGQVGLVATGAGQSIEGVVRITASDMACLHDLPPILAEVRRLAPKLTVDVVASNAIQDLQRREADIAIRHVRPTQPDLIAKRLKDQRAWIYGATSYLDRRGRPDTYADLAGHDMIVLGTVEQAKAYISNIGVPVDALSYPVSSQLGLMVWDLVVQGHGLTFMAERTGDATPGMERVATSEAPVSFETWVTAHRELASSARIRLVFDAMVRHLGA